MASRNDAMHQGGREVEALRLAYTFFLGTLHKYSISLMCAS